VEKIHRSLPQTCTLVVEHSLLWFIDLSVDTCSVMQRFSLSALLLLIGLTFHRCILMTGPLDHGQIRTNVDAMVVNPSSYLCTTFGFESEFGKYLLADLNLSDFSSKKFHFVNVHKAHQLVDVGGGDVTIGFFQPELSLNFIQSYIDGVVLSRRLNSTLIVIVEQHKLKDTMPLHKQIKGLLSNMGTHKIKVKFFKSVYACSNNSIYNKVPRISIMPVG
jgi:hypothetical protein